MAFTGVPVVSKVSENLWRITEVSLAGNATGTIGFSDKTVPAEVSIIAPDWQPYEIDGLVSLQDAVAVRVHPLDSSVQAAVPISVIKTGTTHADFQIALHNDNAGGGQASAPLEIYVEWIGH